MLSIKREQVQSKITLRELFGMLDVSQEAEAETACTIDIGVLTHDGFKRIEGFRCTELLPVRKLTVNVDETSEVIDLHATDRHIVMSDDGWQYLSSIGAGRKIQTASGIATVESCNRIPKHEILYDLQVADVSCFYTNGILSHNSHFLVHLGVQALKLKKNVIHYTFELSETAVGTRYDSHLTNIPSNDVFDNKEVIRQKYEQMDLGRLIIKEYPTGTASVVTIRTHIEKLMMKNFVPHLIVVDYADIMRSTRQYDSLRHELKLIYEELRTLSQEINVPVWTASQSNREGSNADIVGLDNMAEAYGKAMVADLVLSISRKPAEKSSGMARLFVAKNRAGRDGLLFNIRMDTARSHFNVLTPGEEVTLEQAMHDDASDVKEALRTKWEELKRDREERRSEPPKLEVVS